MVGATAVGVTSGGAVRASAGGPANAETASEAIMAIPRKICFFRFKILTPFGSVEWKAGVNRSCCGFYSQSTSATPARHFGQAAPILVRDAESSRRCTTPSGRRYPARAVEPEDEYDDRSVTKLERSVSNHLPRLWVR